MGKLGKLVWVLAILVAFVFSGIAQSNNIAFKTISVTHATVDKNGEWTEWATPTPISVVIMSQEDINAFVLYTDKIQTYTILYALDKTKNSQGHILISFKCVDSYGSNCTVSFAITEDNDRYLKISYSDIVFAYALTSFKTIE